MDRRDRPGGRGQGPPKSFEELYRRYHDRVVSFVIHRGFAVDEARDIAQEIFLRVYEHMESYRGEAEWAFLEVTARNHVANIIRARHAKKREGLPVPVDTVDGLRDTSPRADDRIVEQEERADRRTRLRNAIAALPKGTREAFVLRLQGYSYKDIAARLGIHVDAVRRRVHEGRTRVTAIVGESAPEDDHDREE